jgi:hypothetical protein
VLARDRRARAACPPRDARREHPPPAARRRLDAGQKSRSGRTLPPPPISAMGRIWKDRRASECWSAIRKSGRRVSDKIALKQRLTKLKRFNLKR